MKNEARKAGRQKVKKDLLQSEKLQGKRFTGLLFYVIPCIKKTTFALSDLRYCIFNAKTKFKMLKLHEILVLKISLT